MRHIGLNRAKHFGILFTAVLAFGSVASAAWKEKVLYSFQGGNDGAVPAGGVVIDKAGNLYGATSQGGGSNCPPISNCGTVFQLSPPVKKGDPWTETVLHVFSGVPGSDGATPAGSLVMDVNGNLYGTTGYGGSGGCVLAGIKGGCGTVYELSPPQTKGGAWTYTILYSFRSGNDGYFPWGDLTLDSKGNLYGATQFGGGKGTTCNPFYQYCGTVFELNPPSQNGGKWTEKVLHSFAGIAAGKQSGDGANPNGGLAFDTQGNIFGTTSWGGTVNNCKGDTGIGCGTVFRLKPGRTKGASWPELTLHRFAGLPNDGIGPNGGLILSSSGRLYGTTIGGGAMSKGIVFALVPSTGSSHWKELIVHTFQGREGGNPMGGLLADPSGSLFGTANAYGPHFSGTALTFAPAGQSSYGTYSVSYDFKGAPDAAYPSGILALDGAGNLYGTAQNGGTSQSCTGGCGAVFELHP